MHNTFGLILPHSLIAVPLVLVAECCPYYPRVDAVKWHTLFAIGFAIFLLMCTMIFLLLGGKGKGVKQDPCSIARLVVLSANQNKTVFLHSRYENIEIMFIIIVIIIL